MTEKQSGAELPVVEDLALPYLPLYKRSNPLRILLMLVPVFLGLTGILTVPFKEKPIFFLVFALVEVVSLLCLFLFARKTLQKRSATTGYLDMNAEEFLKAVQTRYAVTLTKNILYVLAQGGTTRLPEHTGKLTHMMLESDESIKTTKLIPARIIGKR
jgi:hypothetical protein